MSGASEMPPRLVDFHCHLDLYPDHPAAVAQAERANVYTLAVTTTPRAWPRNHALASATRHVRAALGLHPQLVKTHAREFATWEMYLPQARYVGEVGLDAGPEFYSSFDLQRQVFEQVLRACARHGNKVLSIHSARAAKAVLDSIEAHFPSSAGTAVLHWFTGSKPDALRATELGCYFSINGEMLRTERHRAMIGALPIERLLTETDGPFTKAEGRPARPIDVQGVVDQLAQLRGVDAASMVVTVQSNLRTLIAGENGHE
jgi:TatD DNase family protein